ncbi:hypothetical protein CesoFtcFv8_009432 [Champsocephalus esox]|uniref:Uncharacterized protein n=1 Tax=Champsocephalus esox TaxID=159716 RepID=A0AAN8C9G4_9TELE|nr:hypothetical protein CesoFtcFv8_009432 [Champsocephalus esox]
MALCWRTHLSQRGEVRGPDRREITQEQTSLNLRGPTQRCREGEIKRCRNVEGGKNVEGEAKYQQECGEWGRVPK